MKRLLLNENDIKLILNDLEKKELKISSHLYKRFPGKSIKEASEIFSKQYDNEAIKRPGLVLLSVILAAHRNYTKQVEPSLDKIRKTNFYSFNDLRQKTKNFSDFIIFCGMRDFEKYSIIVELLSVIDRLKEYSGIDDYQVMKTWALKADYMNFKDDIIGRIRGIGIATFQHLRMNFGANTVKPDQRVKEVLNKEFKFYSENDIDYISAVEYIAKITGKSALYIDQVFVNYGSGYYSNNDFTKIASDKYFEKLNLKGEEDIIVTNCHAGNIVEQMLEYIKNSIKDLDVFIEKRGDGGYIAVVSKLKHLKRGKNVFTYWPTSSSVAVIILGLLPRKTYYSIQEMEEDKLVTKIKLKYKQMVG